MDQQPEDVILLILRSTLCDVQTLWSLRLTCKSLKKSIDNSYALWRAYFLHHFPGEEIPPENEIHKIKVKFAKEFGYISVELGEEEPVKILVRKNQKMSEIMKEICSSYDLLTEGTYSHIILTSHNIFF